MELVVLVTPPFPIAEQESELNHDQQRARTGAPAILLCFQTRKDPVPLFLQVFR